MDPYTPATIDDLFRLTLVDGLKTESEGKTIRYTVVHLRETTVADERIAQRISERVMTVAGVPRLMLSESDFRYALTMRHIEAFACDGQKIGQAVIDLDLLGKLSSHDLGLIEQRVFLITLAAQVRYGTMTQADFELVAGGGEQKAPASPQRVGQAAGVGQADAHPGPGPALLADYVRAPADGAAAGDAG